MFQGIVCPFYAKDDECCDVGCGYITSHDVNMIIKHCSACFQSCPKYRELADRYPDQAAPAGSMPSGDTAPAAARTAAGEGGPARPAAMPREEAAAPSHWGMVALGLSMLVFSLFRAGIIESPSFAGFGLFYAGIWLVVVGLIQGKNRNSFGAVAFTGLGVFWLSLISQIILPQAGMGQGPEAGSLAAYLGMWGMFSSILLLGARYTSRGLSLTFGLLAALLFLLAAAGFTHNDLLTRIACFSGLAGGLTGNVWGLCKLRQSAPAPRQPRLNRAGRAA